jgi:hypothetical protein
VAVLICVSYQRIAASRATMEFNESTRFNKNYLNQFSKYIRYSHQYSIRSCHVSIYPILSVILFYIITNFKMIYLTHIISI